jgi:hypothetical protein
MGNRDTIIMLTGGARFLSSSRNVSVPFVHGLEMLFSITQHNNPDDCILYIYILT